MTSKAAETTWKNLTAEQKLEKRFDAWLSAEGIHFPSAQAAKDYKARAKRFADAFRLKTPDRIPINPSFGGFIAGYYGYSEHDLLYDADKAADAALRGTLEFPTDGKMGAGGACGRMYDILDYKLFSWPGHGVGVNAGWQFNEAEYMTADEYDDFIDDPSDYWTRVHMPRIIGGLDGLSKLSPAVFVIEQVHVTPYTARFGLPEVQASLKKLMQAGQELNAWQAKLAPVNKKLDEMGFPTPGAGQSYAPFDFIGDTLRGTKGIITDMYRCPAKLQEALARATPLMIKMGLSASRMGGCPVVGIPLHKGADGFMSAEQFRVFYWPSLLKVIEGLNREGMIVRLFAEGGYNTRLETIRPDLKKGNTIWHFDYTDMAKAKDIIGDVACLMGNVPGALLFAGTPSDVDAYCKNVIKVAGKNGGYVLATGVGIGRGAKVENVRAMINAVMKYGVY